MQLHAIFTFFFFNDTATTEIYTLSLHDALPISSSSPRWIWWACAPWSSAAAGASWIGYARRLIRATELHGDRKSTRLNSSHQIISYAVFCLKKKKTRSYIQKIQEYLAQKLDVVI